MQRYSTSLLTLSGLLLASANSYSYTSASAETLHSTITKPAVESRLAIPSTYVRLTAPSSQKTISLTSPNADKKTFIGFARTIPSTKSSQQLNWVTTTDGTIVSSQTFTSAEAKSIRLVFDIESIPDNAELHFYSQSNEKSTALVSGAEINKTGQKQYHSPVIDGDTAIVEIHLPAGTNTNELDISVQSISHLSWSPYHPKDLAQAGRADTCHVDLACKQVEWGQTGTAVAKMVFTEEVEVPPTEENGTPTIETRTFLCTGSLIADSDDTTQKPYFLTAQHCISAQEVASTLSTFWFFQRAICDGENPTDVTQVSGGAGLLAQYSPSDATLMLLNQDPPSGAKFAGWTTEPVPPFNTSITGIHHPAGDLKKISSGRVAGYIDNPTFDGISLEDAISVRWSLGVTEGGSSGSPLLTDDQVIVGVLSGGSSSCATPNSNDLYGRFDLAYPTFAPFIGPVDQPTERLQNISTRAFTGEGNDVTIAGFTITGSGDKTVVIRAAGPSIAKSTSGILLDTTLELLKDGEIIASNDDWVDSDDAETIANAGFGLASDTESAILASLKPGSYTAIMRGKNQSTGIGLIAVDQFTSVDDARLSNISTRALVNTDDQITIGGFIIDGEENKAIIVRGIGPSMSTIGVPNTLSDPIIEVYSGTTKIAENDDWQNDPNAGSIQGSGLAPKSGLESALLLSLEPGSYTVKLRGRNNGTGIGLVAIDEL